MSVWISKQCRWKWMERKRELALQSLPTHPATAGRPPAGWRARAGRWLLWAEHIHRKIKYLTGSSQQQRSEFDLKIFILSPSQLLAVPEPPVLPLARLSQGQSNGFFLLMLTAGWLHTQVGQVAGSSRSPSAPSTVVPREQSWKAEHPAFTPASCANHCLTTTSIEGCSV